MRFRILNKLYANLMGYFWLPCELCKKNFGGHEWKIFSEKPSSTSDGKGICPDCTDAGLGSWPKGFQPINATVILSSYKATNN